MQIKRFFIKISIFIFLVPLGFLSAHIGSFGFNSLNSTSFISLDISPTFVSAIKRANAINQNNIDQRFDYFLKKFDEGYEFIPTLRSLIMNAGIPQEFLFLAMAESEFSPRAYSPKKAVGLWQFMPSTAKELGLTINKYIDERRDPIKSTKAAIKYLTRLKNATGKWYLAAIAYNCGLGRLKRAIRKANSSDLAVLLDRKKKYLPAESRQYIMNIVSMSTAFSGMDKFEKLEKLNREYLLNRSAMQDIVPVQIKAGTHLKEVAIGAGIDLATLRKFNSQFRYNFLPPNGKNYTVYLPYSRLSYFKQNFVNSDLKNIFVVHNVKKRETLSSIAKHYKVSVDELMASNHLKNSFISINQALIVPVIKKDAMKYSLKNKTKTPNNERK